MGQMSSDHPSFRFRVSDAASVPLRGYLLRLKLIEGEPSLDRLRTGATLTLQAPDGSEREIRVKAHSATAGRPSRDRLQATREVDIIISRADAGSEDQVVDIGWEVGPPAGRSTT